MLADRADRATTRKTTFERLRETHRISDYRIDAIKQQTYLIRGDWTSIRSRKPTKKAFERLRATYVAYYRSVGKVMVLLSTCRKEYRISVLFCASPDAVYNLTRNDYFYSLEEAMEAAYGATWELLQKR